MSLEKQRSSDQNIDEAARSFGLYMRSRRENAGQSLEEGAAIMEITPDELDRTEQGVNEVPQPQTVARWSKKLGDSPTGIIDMEIAAGHLPEVNTDSLISLERPQLMGALRDIVQNKIPLRRRVLYKLHIIRASIHQKGSHR